MPRFGSFTPSRFQFASVADDRYRKHIREAEENRVESNHTRSAIAGVAVGALLRRGSMTRGKAALIGAAGGLGESVLAHASTRRDNYGDRSASAKRVERLPWQTGAATAALLAGRKVLRRFSVPLHRFKAIPEVAAEGVASRLGQLLRPYADRFSTWSKAAEHGASNAAKAAGLGLGITAADALTSGVSPAPGEGHVAGAAHGLVRGAMYGGALVAAEPYITGIAKRFFRAR